MKLSVQDDALNIADSAVNRNARKEPKTNAYFPAFEKMLKMDRNYGLIIKVFAIHLEYIIVNTELSRIKHDGNRPSGLQGRREISFTRSLDRTCGNLRHKGVKLINARKDKSVVGGLKVLRQSHLMMLHFFFDATT